MMEEVSSGALRIPAPSAIARIRMRGNVCPGQEIIFTLTIVNVDTEKCCSHDALAKGATNRPSEENNLPRGAGAHGAAVLMA